MGTPPFRIEILTQVSGLEFADAWTRRKNEHLDGVACHVIAIEALVASKKAAGRPHDLADVAALEQAAKKTDGAPSVPTLREADALAQELSRR